jgi:CHAD domain-containing protein
MNEFQSSTPSDLSSIFAAAVREQLGRMKEGEAAFRATRDPEGIHAMRTAARRLRTAVRYLAGHLDGDRRRTLKTQLRSLMRVLGPVRDLHVLVEAVRGMAELPVEEREQLSRRAEKRGERSAVKVFGYLDGDNYRALLAGLEEATGSDHPGLPAVAEAPGRLFRAIGETLALRPASWESAAEEHLHEARKSVKRLRYALEAFRPAYGRPVVEAADRCRGLQEALGQIQDVAAFDSALRGHRTFAAGQFLACARMRATGARGLLDELWRRALGPKALGRLGAHLMRRAARVTTGAPPAEPVLRAI